MTMVIIGDKSIMPTDGNNFFAGRSNGSQI